MGREDGVVMVKEEAKSASLDNNEKIRFLCFRKKILVALWKSSGWRKRSWTGSCDVQVGTKANE